jgi:hypothetical protein
MAVILVIHKGYTVTHIIWIGMEEGYKAII